MTAPEEVGYEAVPAELRARPQWVIWRYETRDGKPTKVPYDVNAGTKASTTNPVTWATFDAAVAASAHADGIGYVFAPGDPYTGVDLDHCADDGTLHPDADAIVRQLDSYTELSPSGKGVHVIVAGELHSERNRTSSTPWGDDFEVYDRARFFCMTGRRLAGTPAAINPRQGEIDRVTARMFPAPTVNGSVRPVNTSTIDDDHLLAKAFAASNGAKFQALYDGNTDSYSSPSEADLALCSILAFWTGPDPARIDSLYRNSKLMRPKWDTTRGPSTYGADTILKALNGRVDYYDPGSAPRWKEHKAEPKVEFTTIRNTTKPSIEMSDLGNARRLVAAHGGVIRYVPEWGKWICWDRTRWEVDITGGVERLAKQVVDGMLDEARDTKDDKLFSFAIRCQGASRLHAMVDLASTEPSIPVLVDQLDADPWLLAVANGTLDLRSGEILPHRREDLITKVSRVPWDPDATCPTFDRFLEQILPDKEVRDFEQRIIGYSLTGDVSEQMLVIKYGTGANGKTTLKEVIMALLGEHAKPAAAKLLLATKHDEHPTAIADLHGRRLVTAHEVEDGLRLDEALVKELTGGDRLKARFMRQDYWDFTPTHKLWMLTNHKPKIRGTDNGIWRRIRLIPFEVTIADHEQDKQLPAKLQAELPGILRWAVQGCSAWQASGMCPPKTVVDATARYRIESDLLAQFIEEQCITGVQFQVYSTDLYSGYKTWCQANGLDHPLSQKALAKQLDGKGFDRTENRNHQSIWIGIGLVDDREGFARTTP